MKWGGVVSGQAGERNHRAKLTEGEVREIRRLARDRSQTQRTLAARFGVAESAVSKIVNRTAWWHVQ